MVAEARPRSARKHEKTPPPPSQAAPAFTSNRFPPASLYPAGPCSAPGLHPCWARPGLPQRARRRGCSWRWCDRRRCPCLGPATWRPWESCSQTASRPRNCSWPLSGGACRG
jgi:hypothetical protein